MKVRLLSGHGAGGVLDVPDVEGESLLATGFAERAADVAVPPPVIEVADSPVDVPDSIVPDPVADTDDTDV